MTEKMEVCPDCRFYARSITSGNCWFCETPWFPQFALNEEPGVYSIDREPLEYWENKKD